MALMTIALFEDSDLAGEAVADLNVKGYVDHISVIAKDEVGDISESTVKDDTATDIAAGAATGGALGVIGALIAGAVSLAVPGGPLIVAGPLLLQWGVAGAALGALGGGLASALEDVGLSREQSELYKERIYVGEVLVAVDGDDDRMDEIKEILESYRAHEVIVVKK